MSFIEIAMGLGFMCVLAGVAYFSLALAAGALTFVGAALMVFGTVATLRRVRRPRR